MRRPPVINATRSVGSMAVPAYLASCFCLVHASRFTPMFASGCCRHSKWFSPSVRCPSRKRAYPVDPTWHFGGLLHALHPALSSRSTTKETTVMRKILCISALALLVQAGAASAQNSVILRATLNGGEETP